MDDAWPQWLCLALDSDVDQFAGMPWYQRRNAFVLQRASRPIARQHPVVFLDLLDRQANKSTSWLTAISAIPNAMKDHVRPLEKSLRQPLLHYSCQQLGGRDSPHPVRLQLVI